MRSKFDKAIIYQYLVLSCNIFDFVLRNVEISASLYPTAGAMRAPLCCESHSRGMHWPWMRTAPKMSCQPRSLGALRRWPKALKTLLEHSAFAGAYLQQPPEKKNLATPNLPISPYISPYISLYLLVSPIIIISSPWSLKVKRKDTQSAFRMPAVQL